jgi:hypothetical protein
MNLIYQVARLKELAAKDIPGTFTSDHPEYQYVCEMLNAATALLDVLGEIREGDASALKEIADLLEDSCLVSKAAYVRRYQAMASRMEAERK